MNINFGCFVIIYFFNMFFVGELNNFGDEDCNMMYFSDGKWNDGKCFGLLQFMCEKNSMD